MRIPMTLFLAALLGGLPACGAPDLGDSGLLPDRDLPAAGSALLVRVQDARDAGDRLIAGSASSTAVALRRALQAEGFDLWSSDGASLGEALREAAELECVMVVEVEITEWNEADLEWRDEPDRVGLRLALRSVPEGDLLAWGHDVRLGGSIADKTDTAHRLLEPLVEDLLRPIFGGQHLSGPPEGEG